MFTKFSKDDLVSYYKRNNIEYETPTIPCEVCGKTLVHVDDVVCESCMRWELQEVFQRMVEDVNLNVRIFVDNPKLTQGKEVIRVRNQSDELLVRWNGWWIDEDRIAELQSILYERDKGNSGLGGYEE